MPELTTPPVVPPSWLADRPDAVLVKVRRDRPGGAPDGPVPAGAVVVDLDHWLAGPPTAQDGRHPLPTPEHFAEGMTRAGVGDGDVVAAFDDEGGVVAARLVWMLRVTGHEAALLDGAPPARSSPAGGRSFTPVPWPAGAVVNVDEAVGGRLLLDARSAERFSGAPDPLDPRPGHIPGAKSAPCKANLAADGSLLPADVLRQRYGELGVSRAEDVVVYCGSGVTACHDLLAMEHAGLGRGRLYVGSWSQYANDPDRAAEL